jgi:hypothetical protein
MFLRNEFQRIDADHNGTVSLQEFSSALSLSTVRLLYYGWFLLLIYFASQMIASKKVDVTVSYLAMCIERSHGHCSELTYHEYIAAAMCGRYAHCVVVFSLFYQPTKRRIEIDHTRVHLAFDTLDSGKVLSASGYGLLSHSFCVYRRTRANLN